MTVLIMIIVMKYTTMMMLLKFSMITTNLILLKLAAMVVMCLKMIFYLLNAELYSDLNLMAIKLIVFGVIITMF